MDTCGESMILKVAGVTGRWIIILCLPVLLLSASIAWGFNSLWIYQYGFQKYNVSQTTGLPSAELEKVAKGMISYFNSGGEYVQITVTKDSAPFELFTFEEQIHLKDVKQLVWLDYRILIISFILVLSYSLISIFWHQGVYRRQWARNIVWGICLSLGLILVAGTAVLIDFNWLWLQFHLLSFSNDFWSAEGYMIRLFGGFWYDAILIGVAFMAGLAILLGIASLTYLRLTRSLCE